jgi:hypothetical protein
VADRIEFSLPVVDVTPDEVSEIARAHALRTFDLTEEQPWHIRLLSLGGNDHVLLVALHHILTDGWSAQELTRQLGERYTAYIEGSPRPAATLPVQYADFADWQQRWLQGPEAHKQIEYWKDRLDNIEPLWNLPIDPAHTELHRGVRHRFSIPTTAAQLRRLAEATGTTLYMVTLTGFMLLLAAISGKHDIAVSTPVAGRPRPELDRLIGYFAHVVLMRAELPPGLPDIEALATIRETVLAAFDNQEVAVNAIDRKLGSARYHGRISLFQAHFSLTYDSRRSATFGDLDVWLQFTRVPNPMANIDLELELTEQGDELDAWLIYHSGMFTADEISTFASKLVAIYQRMGAHTPDRPSSTFHWTRPTSDIHATSRNHQP